jgi:UDP-2-acetamido-2,6-beta-L-arabino-hexul-4-ose reductase
VKIVITGATGFLGWHARCVLHTRRDVSLVAVDRERLGDTDALDTAVEKADVVLHCAGVNRATPDELRADNLGLATALTAALDRTGSSPVIIYANSIQSGNGTPFGDGKQAAAERLAEWAGKSGATCVDVRVPNLFGEHGRPHANSVVATFCHELATGGTPTIDVDRELHLLHVQDAVDDLLEFCDATADTTVELAGTPMTVGAILEALTDIHDTYRSGEIPDITDRTRLALFNTYRSFTFPAQFPIRPPVRTDERGDLFECVRARGGQGHTFCSRTAPGQIRGQHFHRRKVERFFVLDGQAEIKLRRLFDDQVVTFAVSGSEPAFVDMPTMWAHSIRNVGSGPLTTLFWANEIFDTADPDTYAEAVERAA